MSVNLIQIEELIDYIENNYPEFDTDFLYSIEKMLRNNVQLSTSQEKAVNNIQKSMINSMFSRCDATDIDIY